MSHDISFILHIMVTFWYYHGISIVRIKRWWISSWYIKISNPYTLIRMPANIWDYDIYIPVSYPVKFWDLYDIDINIFDLIMILWYYHDVSKYQAPQVTSRPTFEILLLILSWHCDIIMKYQIIKPPFRQNLFYPQL